MSRPIDGVSAALRWAPLVCALLHIAEEFVWPGGFPTWYRRYRGPEHQSVTPRFLFVINAILLLACTSAGVAALTPRGASLWLVMAALLASNGLWHVWASLRTHTYSPGMVTGLALYLPLVVVGIPRFFHSGLISPGSMVISLIIGALYPVWSLLFHSRRPPAA